MVLFAWLWGHQTLRLPSGIQTTLTLKMLLICCLSLWSIFHSFVLLSIGGEMRTEFILSSLSQSRPPFHSTWVARAREQWVLCEYAEWQGGWVYHYYAHLLPPWIILCHRQWVTSWDGGKILTVKSFFSFFNDHKLPRLQEASILKEWRCLVRVPGFGLCLVYIRMCSNDTKK